MDDLTSSALLIYLYRRNVTLRAIGHRLGVTAPDGVLTPELRATLAAHKPRLLALLALAEEYRTLLRDAFACLAGDSAPANEQWGEFLDEQARLTDELGPKLATEICLRVGREWRAETAICPWCDAIGDCHEPTPIA
jgi:hypothetical protein